MYQIYVRSRNWYWTMTSGERSPYFDNLENLGMEQFGSIIPDITQPTKLLNRSPPGGRAGRQQRGCTLCGQYPSGLMMIPLGNWVLHLCFICFHDRIDITPMTPVRWKPLISSQWRHNGCDGVSNHQPYHCLFNRLFRRRSNKTSKIRATALCAENSPVSGEFPAQKPNNAENVSIWWRHVIRSFCKI